MARPRRWVSRLRRLLLGMLGAVVLVVGVGLTWLCSGGLWFSGDLSAYIARRHGHLVRAQLERVARGQAYATHYYRLTSSSGLEIELALRRPNEVSERPLPLLVLIDGFKHGRDAIDRIGDPGRVVLATISWPFAGRWPAGRGALAWVAQSRDLRRAFHDTPSALMLALDFLLDQPGVDPKRVELIGVSLGSPAACVTGAVDPRFTRIWSVQGGAGYPILFDDLLARVLHRPALRRLSASCLTLLIQRVEPADYVGRIAPREFVAINARDDEFFPIASAELLYARAKEPKQQIWLEGRHVGKQPERIGELMAIVLARVEGDAP